MNTYETRWGSAQDIRATIASLVRARKFKGNIENRYSGEITPIGDRATSLLHVWCQRLFLVEFPDTPVVFGPDAGQIQFLRDTDAVHCALLYGEEWM